MGQNAACAIAAQRKQPMKPRLQFETRLLAAFAAAVLLLALLLGSTVKAVREYEQAAQTVAHTHQTLTEISRARAGVLLLETLTRGYVISADAGLLPQRGAALAELEAALGQVQTRSADAAQQQRRWLRLRAVADQRIAISNQLTHLRQSAGFGPAQAYFLSAPVEEIRTLMLEVLQEMETAEQHLLHLRLAERQRMQTFVLAFDVLLALALFALLSGAFALIRRQLRALEASRHALALSEQSLSTTLHSIGDAVLATDTQGRITRMNAVAERLTGWPLAEALGRPVDAVFRIVNEQTRAPVEVPVARVLASGELQGLANHSVLIARDGREWPIADSAAPIRDAVGQVGGVVLVWRDMTVERLAERTVREHNQMLEASVRERTAQLRQSEQRLRLFIDHAPAGIAMLDRDMRYLAVSRRWLMDYRLGEQDLIGRSHYEVFPEISERWRDIHRRCLAGAVERADADSFPRGDGSVDWVRWEVRPWFDAAGHVGGIVLFSELVTERWRSERQRSAEQSVLEAISTGRPLNEILALLAHEVEALLPGALCSILLLDGDGIHLRYAAAPSLPPAFTRAIDGQAIGPQAGSCGSAAYHKEPVLVSDIATDPLWADYAALVLPLGLRACWSTPVLSGAGQVLGVFALYYRESRSPGGVERQLIERWTWLSSIAIEHRRQEDELRQSNADLERRVAARTVELERARLEAVRLAQVKDTFLATMSHEIRTPMNALLGMLELLALRSQDGEQTRMLDVAQHSGKSLLRIIDDILDFSRIEAGKLEIQAEPTSIAELIELTADSFMPIARSKGLRLLYSVSPQLSPALRADRLRLRQILNNFVSNAIKFTERGEVQIRAELIERQPQSDRVRLSVSDTGVGIAAEVQARLFQPFSQADSETTRRYGGSGLGLAICQRLAELMGGQIELHSSPGQGTTLSLSLELPRIDAAEWQAAQAAQAQGRTAPNSPGVGAPPPSVAQAQAAGTLVLLVDDHASNRDLLIEQLRILGYAAQQAATSMQAWRKWESAHYGLLITDCHMPDMDGYQLTRRIRHQEAETGRARTPILAWTANALSDVAAACAEAGMDDILVKPAGLSALRAKLQRWLPLPAQMPAANPPLAPPAPAAQAPLDPAEPQVLHRALLHELSDGDAELERRILLRFRASNHGDTEALLRAVAAQDAAAVAHYAHRIKGAALMIGANEFARACAALEQAGKSADWAAIETAQSGFRHTFERLERVLSNLPELPSED